MPACIHAWMRAFMYACMLVLDIHSCMYAFMNAHMHECIHTLCPEKSEPFKDFATTCVNLHQIKYFFHT